MTNTAKEVRWCNKDLQVALAKYRNAYSSLTKALVMGWPASDWQSKVEDSARQVKYRQIDLAAAQMAYALAGK